MAKNAEIQSHGPWNKPGAPTPVNSIITRPTMVADLRNQFGAPENITHIFSDEFGPNVAIARFQRTSTPAYGRNASSPSPPFPEQPFGIESTSYSLVPANQPVHLPHASSVHSVTSAGQDFLITATEAPPRSGPYFPKN